jgi:predicted  nucleic acid-binding Zn-ribbon protein
MWLVGALKPRMIVELGVHTGNSYCAFLQAAQTLGLDTRCFGVDHWYGDEHAGHYGDEIYQEFRAYHDPRYGTFSTLLRSSFEAALPYFSDGSVDLLHIDGFHTAEAVSADFKSWLPKVSSRGVALFHDSNVRERGFGIWQFWEELSSRYPHFEFVHSHGLGVAYLGTEPLNGPLKALFATKTDAENERVRGYFARLGTSVAERRAGLTLAANLDATKARIAELEREHAAVRAELARTNIDTDALKVELAAKIEAAQSVRAMLDQTKRQLADLNTQLSNAGALANGLEAKLHAAQGEVARANSNAAALKQNLEEKLHAAQDEVARAYSSADALKKDLEEKLHAAQGEAARAHSSADAVKNELEAKLRAATLQLQIQASLVRQRIGVAARLQQELLVAKSDKRSYELRLQEILQSTTWRYTGPFRRAVILLRRLLPPNPLF